MGYYRTIVPHWSLVEEELISGFYFDRDKAISYAESHLGVKRVDSLNTHNDTWEKIWKRE